MKQIIQQQLEDEYSFSNRLKSREEIGDKLVMKALEFVVTKEQYNEFHIEATKEFNHSIDECKKFISEYMSRRGKKGNTRDLPYDREHWENRKLKLMQEKTERIEHTIRSSFSLTWKDVLVVDDKLYYEIKKGIDKNEE